MESVVNEEGAKNMLIPRFFEDSTFFLASNVEINIKWEKSKKLALINPFQHHVFANHVRLGPLSEGFKDI